jgi:transglutaminase-like putative cysteine protease
MNLRLTLTAGIAVVLSSVSLYPLIQTGSWFWAGIGAVIMAMAAGIITRAPTGYAAVAGSVLALIAVCPLLIAGSWPLKILGLVIVAVTAASRPRLRQLQVLATLITYLAAQLVYLNLVLASSYSLAGVIPTRSSVAHLWSLAGQGMDARGLAPPVPGTPGVVLLAGGGIGLIAVVTDLLAVRLRSPAVAGLPLLALFCVRITTSARQDGAGAATVFCLGLIGYLALLAADGRDRLRIWGRVVTAWNVQDREPVAGDLVDTRALSAAGRRIGLAAACAALALPLLVPGVSLHDLLKTDSGNGGPGGHTPGGAVALPNPLVQMRNQLQASSTQTVLTYQTTAPDPPEQYLQVYVLNYNPGSGNWTLVPLGPSTQVGNRTLRAAPGLTAGTRVAHTRTVVSLSQSLTGYDSKLGFLPVPYAPSTLRVSAGTWDEDNSTLMLYSPGTALSGLGYTVSSTEPSPGAAQLDQLPSYPASISDNYLAGFPAGPNGELAKLAAQITKGATTPYQKALKLQSYFTSGAFSYNLSVNLPDNIAGLTDFLFSVKAGFCQQFAFAMAALARLADIPSRVAVGYTAGSQTSKKTWKVTTADAHAWPELYFTGVGWLRFEPTPGGATGQGTATVPQYAPATSPGTSVTPPTSDLGGAPGGTGAPGGLNGVRPGNGGVITRTPVHHPRSPTPWILLGIAAFLIAALLTPVTVRVMVRRRRLQTTGDAALAHAAWREFCDNLADYGFGYRASETPRAVSRRIATTLRLDLAASGAVTRIAGAEERARYAAAPLGSGTLRDDTAAIRQALSREASWPVRVRAWLLPRSTLDPVRAMLRHVPDVFGWMDVAGLRVRNTIRHQE